MFAQILILEANWSMPKNSGSDVSARTIYDNI